MLAMEHLLCLFVLQCVVFAQGQDVIVSFTRDGANLKGDGGQRERKPSLPSMITRGGMWCLRTCSIKRVAVFAANFMFVLTWRPANIYRCLCLSSAKTEKVEVLSFVRHGRVVGILLQEPQDVSRAGTQQSARWRPGCCCSWRRACDL